MPVRKCVCFAFSDVAVSNMLSNSLRLVTASPQSPTRCFSRAFSVLQQGKNTSGESEFVSCICLVGWSGGERCSRRKIRGKQTLRLRQSCFQSARELFKNPIVLSVNYTVMQRNDQLERQSSAYHSCDPTRQYRISTARLHN